MGGLFGALLIGPLADAEVSCGTSVNLTDTNPLFTLSNITFKVTVTSVCPLFPSRSWDLFGRQVGACAFGVVYAYVVSYLLLRFVALLTPLVPPIEVIAAGLDSTIHGEHAYDMDHAAKEGLGNMDQFGSVHSVFQSGHGTELATVRLELAALQDAVNQMKRAPNVLPDRLEQTRQAPSVASDSRQLVYPENAKNAFQGHFAQDDKEPNLDRPDPMFFCEIVKHDDDDNSLGCA